MSARSAELLDVARRIADALPAEVVEEAAVTGSVSRGVADDVSDIEMLLVTHEELDLETCFELARVAGLEDLGTWGAQGTSTRRVSGYREGVPIELIWWSRKHAESSVDALLRGEMPSTADALVHGVALRTAGGLARWQERLAVYPEELVAQICEDAALPWGGFAAAGLLTLVRPGERLALLEWMVDGAVRAIRIVYALNRTWQPTTKRLAARVESLPVKPDRLAERISLALSEPDSRRALLTMTRLQADAVALAPDGPNIVRARAWLADGIRVLEGASHEGPTGSEAELVPTEHGLVPKGQGWFVVNARETQWWDRGGRGVLCEFEGAGFEGATDFEQLGINLTILGPGEPMAMYHRENDQEDFLVLAGEALAIVEGAERPLRRWGFLHCPPGTNHVIVGAGSEPCLVLAVGARDRSVGPDWGGYTVDETAQRHGAGVERETAVPAEAYARFPAGRLVRYRDGWLPG